VKSDLTLTAEIFRKVQAGAREATGREVLVRVNPEMAHHLEAEEREGVERLQDLIGGKVVVQGVPSYQREQYDFTFR
jgi:Ribonuclease G/E